MPEIVTVDGIGEVKVYSRPGRKEATISFVDHRHKDGRVSGSLLKGESVEDGAHRMQAKLIIQSGDATNSSGRDDKSGE